VKSVCFIAFWYYEKDYEESETEHKYNVELLERLKLEYKDKPITFMYVNALEHGKQLMFDTDVSDILPAMYNLRDM
jgi:hypothetical protein